MKAVVQYPILITKEITIPKKLEFKFKKDEEDYTDEEWDFLDKFEEILLIENKIDITDVDLSYLDILDYSD